MAGFQELRLELQQARAQKEQAEAQLRQAHERLQWLDAELATLGRSFDPQNPQHVQRREDLLERRATAQGTRKEVEARLARAGKAVQGAFTAFGALTDPRQVVGHMSDRYPFLLLPVRLETRFKTITTATEPPVHQLWVRVYPDSCSIDTFEDTLSEVELENARAYWLASWKAAGIEDQERGAWRGLVGSHGSGRAAWLVEHYRPLNQGEKPAKTKASDVVLVVPTDVPLNPKEPEALAAFWSAVWLADGSKAQEDAALLALKEVVGEPRAVELVAGYQPVNLAERPRPPLTKAQVTVSTAFVVFPKREEVDTRRNSWSRAPKVTAFPDRFVLIAYREGEAPLVALGNPILTPLVAGPDPSAAPGEQLRQENGELILPDEMKWMVDFERAVQVGMGLRVPLSVTQAQHGFDRLLVVGVRSSADEQTAKAELEALLQHHSSGRSGFSLVPQGTPTNNTEEGSAGFTRSDDADASYDELFKQDALFESSTDWLEKRDGQWLAEWLGINPGLLKKSRHASGSDQAEARALNMALWPATLGYWMETLMEPVFPREAVDRTRWFFNRFVSGRGPVPAVRIGSQPYGILPTTAFSRMEWMDPRRESPSTHGFAAGRDPNLDYLRQLYALLKVADGDWAQLAKQVSHSGKKGDAHQLLLDVVGLHSGSVEFSQRYSESLEQLFNRLNLFGLGQLLGSLVIAGVVEGGTQLLGKFGYTGEENPDLLYKFFFGKHHTLKGPLVDDRPLSEMDPVRAYTASGKNYLEWLSDAANVSLDALRLEDGFLEDKPPHALLYLLLRHSLQVGYYDVSLRLHEQAQLLTGEELRVARREASFVHVKEMAARSESRYHFLYRAEPAITSNQAATVGDWIGPRISSLETARLLHEQLRALERLKHAPTARLERLLTEHVDLCTYRLDAWMQGLVHYQLAAMRGVWEHSDSEPQQGIHLGAYAWLENVRPENKVLTPVQLSGELAKEFNNPADPPLMRDSTNQGYIHAPSLNQAVTAAVLRNGYLSNATPENRQTLGVNLTSERVRVALGVLEGIRGGQSLGALLGYQFERGLHDRHGLVEVDKFIYDIRRAFPLRANRLKSTQTDEGVSIEALEARNVMDGLRLVEHIKKTGNKAYPFGKNLEPANSNEQKAINAEVDRLLESHDAVADLTMAEGVFQAVQGNYDRVASALDASGKGSFPPEPEVVRTPTNGSGLTHRVGLHLEAGADPTASPVAGLAMTPRAQAEPALNRWLATVLPPLQQVACKVVFRAAATNTEASDEVTLFELGLQPIDVLYLVRDESEQAMSELDDRIVQHVMVTHALRPDGGVRIRYLETAGAATSLFALMPLVRSLRRLVFSSRALRASDLTLGNEATQAHDAAVQVDAQRIVLARTAMQSARADLASLQAGLEGPLSDLPARRGELLANIDTFLQQASTRLLAAARFGLPKTGAGFVHDGQQRLFSAVLRKVDERVKRWDGRLAEFDTLIAAYAALPGSATDAERFALLERAEPLVSEQLTAPRPATPAAYLAVLDLKRATFVARRGDFTALLSTARTSIGQLLTDAQPLSAAGVDFLEFSFTQEEDQVVTLAAEILSVVRTAVVELDRRLAASQALLGESAATASAPARVKALQDAAKALLGDDFVLVPEFMLRPAQGDELEKAAGASATLLEYLRDTEGVDFPVDDWLYGVARVRDKMRAWEGLVMMTEALGIKKPDDTPLSLELSPIQLPFREDDSWLALRFPPAYKLDGDRLLYTAYHTVPFQKAAPHCGLLLDEWTEVIPSDEAMTGVAFHYDRPNSEPPQVMLLVTPTAFRGTWRWEDLVDALNETIEMAKKRAVEPAHLDQTPYARFLPATLMAVTVNQLTISANLAMNNAVNTLIQES